MLIDSHAHLFWEEFQTDLDLVIDRAKKVGVGKIIIPGLSVETSQAALKLSRKWPTIIKSAIGVHPEEVLSLNLEELQAELSQLENLVKTKRDEVIAIGEVGLDKHTLELQAKLKGQKEIFRKMVELGKRYNLPLIIHSREAVREILEIVDQVGWFKGVFHCFSGSEEELNQVLKRGFKISFCGNITWSKRVSKLVVKTPMERLLLETDSPFMTPRDQEGQVIGNLRNEPKNVRILAARYSQLKQVGLETIEKVTTANAKALFKL